MFTGIIETVGKLGAIQRQNSGARLHITADALDLSSACIGDSIAVNGVCLTVTDLPAGGFTADVSNETLSCTTFAQLTQGARVNLECSLTPDTRLGGHWVSGHVDAVANVVNAQPDGQSVRLRIKVPDTLAKYIAAKGSICVDGVSLTVNTVAGAEFEVNIIPHTLQATTLGEFTAGRHVNIEVDIIARYLERLLLGERAAEV